MITMNESTTVDLYNSENVQSSLLYKTTIIQIT